MKAPKKTKTLLRLINDQIQLWQPSAKTLANDKKRAAEEIATAKEIAAKLYQTHALVGEHETYKIFGYGSLLNQRSRARTMTPIDVTYDKVKGYRRIYNLMITQGTCLNVEPHEFGVIDGALCEIGRDDMMNFILREFQYDVVKITTMKGEEAFMVMADAEKGHNVATPDELLIKRADEEQSTWQDVMPRLDYINACYYGVYQLAGEANIFLTQDNVLYDNVKLSTFIEELSPTITEVQPEGGTMEVNRLTNYWKSIDSAY